MMGTEIDTTKEMSENVFSRESNPGLLVTGQMPYHQGPVVQKPINANPRLKINQGVYYSTTKCCSTLIFGKTLH